MLSPTGQRRWPNFTPQRQDCHDKQSDKERPETVHYPRESWNEHGTSQDHSEELGDVSICRLRAIGGSIECQQDQSQGMPSGYERRVWTQRCFSGSAASAENAFAATSKHANVNKPKFNLPLGGRRGGWRRDVLLFPPDLASHGRSKRRWLKMNLVNANHSPAKMGGFSKSRCQPT